MLCRFLILPGLISFASAATAYDTASIDRAKIFGRLQALVGLYSTGMDTCDINKIDLTAMAKEKNYLFGPGFERERAEMLREESRALAERAKPTNEACATLFNQAASIHVTK